MNTRDKGSPPLTFEDDDIPGHWGSSVWHGLRAAGPGTRMNGSPCLMSSQTFMSLSFFLLDKVMGELTEKEAC